MRHYEILIKDPIVAQHLPETYWYNSRSLMSMLNKYPVIYLKPNDNTGGNGIIRISCRADRNCLISYEKNSIQVELSGLGQLLKRIIYSPGKYIVQQGIDLATHNNKPFDMRIVLQRVINTWRVTLTSAKVATNAEAIVTNVARGAEDYLLHNILQSYDQRQEPMATFREIIDLSHQIASVIGNHLPLRITGLDLALDKAGRLWFIEANENPECVRCKLVNDEVSVKKYEIAKNINKRLSQKK